MSHRVNSSDITFRLWTRELKNHSVPLDPKNLHGQNSIIPNKPIKVLIHGFTNSPDTAYIFNMTKEYLIKDNMNVIQVDWSKLAYDPYPIVAGCLKDIAKYIGKLIIALNTTLNIPYDNFHIIGPSLGAHLTGFIGKYVFKATGFQVGRITGLDPAAPLFAIAPESYRLSKDDAVFVDVIHTDRYRSGITFALGKADFFPENGEAPQRSCKKGDWPWLTEILSKDILF